jgi:hypothetical protein
VEQNDDAGKPAFFARVRVSWRDDEVTVATKEGKEWDWRTADRAIQFFRGDLRFVGSVGVETALVQAWDSQLLDCHGQAGVPPGQRHGGIESGRDGHEISSE